MMKRFSISKKLWVAFSAVAVMGILFAYYLLVHVENKEADIIAEKYRILNRTHKNVLSIKEEYDLRIENFTDTYNKNRLGKIYRELRDRVSLSEFDLFNAEVDYLEDQNKKRYLRKIEKIEATIDSAKNERNRIDLLLTGILKSLDLKVATYKYDSIKYEDLSNIYFKIGDLKNSDNDNPYGYDFDYDYTDYYEENQKSDSCLRVPVRSFLERSNVATSHFDEFLLIRKINKKEQATKSNDAEEYTTTADLKIDVDCCDKKEKSKTDKAVSAIAFQTFTSKIDLNTSHFDSLFTEDHGLRSAPGFDIVLSGASYKMFPHRMQFDTDEEWIFCGLVKTSSFKQASRAVDPWKLTFALLIVIFLILAMPILKLLIMSAIERLRIINVWSAGFSLTVGTAFLILILLSANEFVGYKYKTDSRLIRLSNDIKNRFISELNTIYKQLELSKTTYRDSLNAEFKLRSSIFNGMSDSVMKSRFPYHRFFNEMIWLNDEGRQRLRITTYKQDSHTVPMKLATREYFRAVLESKLWIMPVEKRDISVKQFALESIHSRATGELWMIPVEKEDTLLKQFALQSIRSRVSGEHEIGF